LRFLGGRIRRSVARRHSGGGRRIVGTAIHSLHGRARAGRARRAGGSAARNRRVPVPRVRGRPVAER